MSPHEAALVILTHRRQASFVNTIKYLEAQTALPSLIIVSDSGPNPELVQQAIKGTHLDIVYKRADKDTSPWRRFTAGKALAEAGYEAVLFLDDDICIPPDYIEKAVSLYEPCSYKSWWAWDLNGGYAYEKDRIRILKPNTGVNYCGTGASVIDPRVFADPDFYILPTPDTIWGMEDVWLSYFSKERLGWKLEYLDIDGISFSADADDDNALYRAVENKTRTSITKREFVELLKSQYGWSPKG